MDVGGHAIEIADLVCEGVLVFEYLPGNVVNMLLIDLVELLSPNFDELVLELADAFVIVLVQESGGVKEKG